MPRLGNHLRRGRRAMTHLAAIQIICDEFCVTQKILHGKSRKAEIVDARRITAHILTFKFGLRSLAVARVLHRDRSMISHYLVGFERNIKTDIALKVKYERALSALAL